jgi:precorrin-6B methylase 2
MRIARHIKKLVGYVPGEQPKSREVVKLNTNENPYPPSPKCAAVLSSFNLDNLRRYPDPNCSALAKAIAEANGTTPDRVFIGGTSGRLDEIIDAARRANPRVRICATAVTLETLADLSSFCAREGVEDPDIVQVSVSRAQRVGRHHLMKANNPVYIATFDCGGTEGER